MCGIAGIYSNLSSENHHLQKMLDSLEHRGPDQRFDYHIDGLSMGMTRLSINDLVSGGQPFFNKSKTISVIYNGEIYNYQKLRQDLERNGKTFTTQSDGEVIAHLYEEVGESVFGFLDGMFAIAIWDNNRKTLILGRDSPGEKPLYYSKSNNLFAFSSEIKSLTTLKNLELTINRQAIWDFPTFLWVPEPSTVYEEIFAVPAGHLLRFNKSEISIKKFKYNLNQNISLSLSDNDAIDLTRSIVESSITSRLMSDVPVGSFLSGGLDSSIVASVAAQNLSKLDTFTISFENIDDPYHGKADESVEASETAKLIGSNHHTIHVSCESLRKNLDDFCRYGDQPFSVSSGLGILAISEAAKNLGVKVLLTGDGADECFGGYSWYEHMAKINKLNGESTDDCISFQNIGQTLDYRLKKIAKMSPQHRAWAWHYYAHETEKKLLFSESWSENLNSSYRHFNILNHNSTALDFIEHDRNFYFPNEMLTKVDRMTMAHSVEGRTPFAARAVQELAESLSINQMVRKDTLKWVLRKAFHDVLPMEVIERKKHGFNVPIDNWLKNQWADLVEEAFSNGSPLHRFGIIGNNSYQSALNLLEDKTRLNGHTIFSMIMLNKWLGQ